MLSADMERKREKLSGREKEGERERETNAYERE